MNTSAQAQWQELQTQLTGLRTGQRRVADFSAAAQAASALHSVLPARFGTVLGELLNRLESSALFSEESCSFSQGELLDSLQMWLDKARPHLPAA